MSEDPNKDAGLDPDGYVSAEDEDFVYGEDIAADSFEDSCEKEAREAGLLTAGKKRKRPSKSAPTGRGIAGRAGGLVLDESGQVPKEIIERQQREREEREAAEAAYEAEQERAKKSRIDDLWAELNGGTAPAPTPTPSTSVVTDIPSTAVTTGDTNTKQESTSAAPKVDSSLAALLGDDTPAAKPQKTAAEIAAALLAKNNNTSDDTAKEGEVMIKETYDFAGRKVEVAKAVSANSRAAKKFQTMQGGSGIDKLLASMGKKKQMTTTTKSRLDWEKHTTEAGIKDDLRTAAKDGYLEKQAFLGRTELREFEKRRTVNRKRLGITDD